MEPEDLVGISEIAEMCGVVGSAVINWRKRPWVNFPEPWGEWKMGSLWVRTEVEEWWTDRAARKRSRLEYRITKLQQELDRVS